MCLWAVWTSSKALCACELFDFSSTTPCACEQYEFLLKLYVRVSYLNFIYGSMCVWAIWISSMDLCACELFDFSSTTPCACELSEFLLKLYVRVSYLNFIYGSMCMWAIWFFVYNSMCLWAVWISSKALCACELSEFHLWIYVRVSRLNFV